MKKKILIITFLLFSNIIFCQETEADTKYKAETKSLKSYILKVFLSTPYLNIERTATRVKIENCKEKYESPIFDKSELDYIKQSINNPKIAYWTEEYFPTLKIIEDKKNEKNINDKIECNSEIKYQYKGTIAEFSSPIFLRNFEIALVRFSEVSGELSGFGYEGIFIKKGNDWKIDTCSWDN
jgi:hypothetical protein